VRDGVGDGGELRRPLRARARPLLRTSPTSPTPQRAHEHVRARRCTRASATFGNGATRTSSRSPLVMRGGILAMRSRTNARAVTGSLCRVAPSSGTRGHRVCAPARHGVGESRCAVAVEAHEHHQRGRCRSMPKPSLCVRPRVTGSPPLSVGALAPVRARHGVGAPRCSAEFLMRRRESANVRPYARATLCSRSLTNPHRAHARARGGARWTFWTPYAPARVMGSALRCTAPRRCTQTGRCVYAPSAAPPARRRRGASGHFGPRAARGRRFAPRRGGGVLPRRTAKSPTVAETSAPCGGVRPRRRGAHVTREALPTGGGSSRPTPPMTRGHPGRRCET